MKTVLKTAINPDTGTEYQIEMPAPQMLFKMPAPQIATVLKTAINPDTETEYQIEMPAPEVVRQAILKLEWPPEGMGVKATKERLAEKLGLSEEQKNAVNKAGVNVFCYSVVAPQVRYLLHKGILKQPGGPRTPYFPVELAALQTPLKNNVFSTERVVQVPPLVLPDFLKPNTRLKMDGLELLSHLPKESVPVAFLDPQYRGVLDKMNYGNEGKNREKRRCALVQMSEELISEFIRGIDNVLIPSGHLFLWVDKFHLCQGFKTWFDGTQLDIVDLIVWHKDRFGMGYRSRRVSEYCVVLQKHPKRAKGVWQLHNIRDVWIERTKTKAHPHQKPIGFQTELIAAVSNEGDYVIDPAAGSFSVMAAAHARNRNFIGCDLEG